MASSDSTRRPACQSVLERTRLTIHAQNFIVYFTSQHSLFETGAFVSLVQRSAVQPLPADDRDIARLIGVSPMLFARAWKRLHRYFRITRDGWVLRPNEFISVKLVPVPSTRVPLRHLLSKLIAFWGRCCVYCGVPVSQLAIEHIVPKARGGSDDITNLTLACQPCNSRKGTHTAEEFGFPDIHCRAKGIDIA